MRRPRICEVLGTHNVLQGLGQDCRRLREQIAAALPAARLKSGPCHRGDDAGQIGIAAGAQSDEATDRLYVTPDDRQ